MVQLVLMTMIYSNNCADNDKYFSNIVTTKNLYLHPCKTFNFPLPRHDTNEVADRF